MKLLDVNVLVYAVDTDSPHYEKARAWLENLFSGDEPIALAWTVIVAFLRITTRRGILRRPLEVQDALAFVDAWLELPHVNIVEADHRHWPILRTLIGSAGTAGNLASDAYLAALAIGGGWTVVSADRDFRRFAGLSVLNPLETSA